MKFYPKLIKTISRNVIRTLVDDGSIEVDKLNFDEAVEDVAAVLRSYGEAEERVRKATDDALKRRGLDRSNYGRTFREIADVNGFRFGDDGEAFIVEQIIAFLLNSKHVDEIYADDDELTSRISKVVKDGLKADDDLDQEVRMHLKHLQEGTTAWEIEYKKVAEQIRRIKGMNS